MVAVNVRNGASSKLIDRALVEQAVQPLRDCGDVERVIVATADGIAYVDDATLVDRERGAASAASLMGVVDLTAQSLGLDGLQGAVIYGSHHEIVAQPVTGTMVIVVVARRGSAREEVYRLLQTAVASLEGLLTARQE